MTFSDPQNSPFLAHIVSQLETNVEFLASQGYITQADASQFLAKLPRPNSQSNTTTPSFPSPTPRAIAPAPAAVATPTPASTTAPQARVLWAWSGQVCLESAKSMPRIHLCF